jgi:bifunctional non-homologous end joining protein LigD
MLRDRLQTYREKRDFTQTAEPSGKGRKAKRGRSFVVQKHAASRLHYDFRLEHAGVLLSWACPKGPSLDPADKRLAVHVEDHPVEYGGFEGTIPKDEYGGGTVMLWDRGSWEPHGDVDEGLAKGKLAFTLHGKRLIGDWALVRLRSRDGRKDTRENWLLVKERDGAAKSPGTALVDRELTSIKSGRTMDQIARGRAVWHSNRTEADASVTRNDTRRKTSSKDSTLKKAAKSKTSGRAARSTAKARSAGQATWTSDEIEGVHITNPDRVLYPEQGVTKRALIDYYLAIAEHMLPYVVGRPLALVRCPQGRGKECFFQKHASQGWPDAFGTIRIREKSATREYMYIEDVRGLVAAAQMGVLELHIWGSRADGVERPDRMVFDLDPDETLPFDQVTAAARDLKKRLEAFGLQSFPMVTGGKGIHVVVPLARKHGWDEHRTFAEALARQMAAEEPERFVANMSKAKRRGKIFVDYLRNQRGSTAIAPFSTRAKTGATVALPVSWARLSRLKDAQPATIRNAVRVLGRTNPWPGYEKIRQTLPPWRGEQ